MTFACAHRGLSADHPENTLRAFQAAADAGFHAFELDVRLTRDDEVVVLHDEGLERTTGQSGRVRDMSYDEVRAYDTGAGPVPRLDDLLSTFDAWQGLWDIEVKDTKATDPTLDILDHHDLGVRAMVSSMDPAVLRTVAERSDEHPRGLIVLGPPDEEDVDEARQADCAWLLVDTNFLDEQVAGEVLDHGFLLGVWTENNPERARAVAALGAHCVITDTQHVLEALPKPREEAWF